MSDLPTLTTLKRITRRARARLLAERVQNPSAVAALQALEDEIAIEMRYKDEPQRSER